MTFVEYALKTGRASVRMTKKQKDNLWALLSFNLPLAKAGLVPWTKEDIDNAQKVMKQLKP